MCYLLEQPESVFSRCPITLRRLLMKLLSHERKPFCSLSFLIPKARVGLRTGTCPLASGHLQLQAGMSSVFPWCLNTTTTTSSSASATSSSSSCLSFLTIRSPEDCFFSSEQLRHICYILFPAVSARYISAACVTLAFF